MRPPGCPPQQVAASVHVETRKELIFVGSLCILGDQECCDNFGSLFHFATNGISVTLQNREQDKAAMAD